MALPLIIVADDNPDVIKGLEFHLQKWGYRVRGAPSKHVLLKAVSEELPALVILDLQFGDDDGLEVLQLLLQRWPALKVVILTGFASVHTAVSAIKLGAQDYLSKPPDLDRMRILISQTLERTKESARPVVTPTTSSIGNIELLGISSAMQKIQSLIDRVAVTEATVLILGESGTGKEIVAKCIHARSKRSAHPFIALNMAALPKELVEATLFGHEKGAFTGADQAKAGCCEAASGGTLFLDEIGEMDLSLQAKLLRFLQDRTVLRVGGTAPITTNTRIVAATNRDLLERVKNGQFREDLYYRLRVVPIQLPPLRERIEDVELLAQLFLLKAIDRNQLEKKTWDNRSLVILKKYPWPGNVRELENVTEQIAILSPDEVITPDSLPVEFSGVEGGVVPKEGEMRLIDEVEKKAIIDALDKSKGRVRPAAALLGLGAATVYRKIKHFGISLDKYQATSGDDS